ncbi:helix-turn-helix transcriptional regulator [Actinokineospora auranticolor]|uniref:Helix-turn-helix protein n=1 Tax=Actinokineospora auranticolor TaxID=155976 RepID=A0A2S6GLX5_9PSEU|nr:helix-turn-helix transcriptional regulator [Actinokineospora auranticolor]PPK66234.1 helix-turn-helix protein [Actinokineospora auranticolor]
MSKRALSTAHTRLLHALNDLKATARLTDAEAAKATDLQGSKISRILQGQSKAKPEDVRLLARAYNATPEVVEALVDLAERAWRAGDDWTTVFSAFTDAFWHGLDMERHATEINQIQSEIVPGLAQTEHYRLALQQAAGPLLDRDLVLHGLRQRHALLERVDPPPPRVRMILSESCLRRRHGTSAVMAEQMRALLRFAARPTVELRLAPFAGPPARHSSLNFTLMHIPGAAEPIAPMDVVCLEHLADAQYLRDPEHVRPYQDLFEQRWRLAVAGEACEKMISGIADDYDRTTP